MSCLANSKDKTEPSDMKWLFLENLCSFELSNKKI